jgi:putative flavoprotein involved in K+ transport
MTRGRPRDTVIDCAVVGAGPAGLASSAALTRRGVEHVVLERGRVGQSWREQRWDSLRVNNPGWMNPMLGEQEPDTYLTADEVVERLDKLATACPVREGARHRGRDTVEWLVECGFFQQRPQDLVDPSVMAAPQPLLAPGGRSMSLQALARAGVTLAGRLVAAHGERVAFDDSAPANLAAGDAFAARIRAMLDQVIRQAGLHAPPVEPDDADTPVELDPPMALDLGTVPVGSVVWCTGYTGDFSWLPPALLNPDGRPKHHDGAAPLPGVWYVGLRWLTHRASGNFLGLPSDAAATADAVVTPPHGSHPAHPGHNTAVTAPRPASTGHPHHP